MKQPITLARLNTMKRTGEKIACLTAYDASFAALQDVAGVEVLLVGDSLGMVLHGATTTQQVTMADMIYHTRLVASGRQRALIISDMPYNSYQTPAQALNNAQRLVDSGADMVKLEGGAAISKIVALLTKQGVPVCGHLGLLPQALGDFSVRQRLSDYQRYATTEQAAVTLAEDALCLQESGIASLVLECVSATTAKALSELLDVPTIGIGAGVDCDAQVLVMHDMLGITLKPGKFSKDFLRGEASILAAFQAYVRAVKDQSFPAGRHLYC